MFENFFHFLAIMIDAKNVRNCHSAAGYHPKQMPGENRLNHKMLKKFP
jgi:hypothetical protein